MIFAVLINSVLGWKSRLHWVIRFDLGRLWRGGGERPRESTCILLVYYCYCTFSVVGWRSLRFHAERRSNLYIFEYSNISELGNRSELFNAVSGWLGFSVRLCLRGVEWTQLKLNQPTQQNCENLLLHNIEPRVINQIQSLVKCIDNISNFIILTIFGSMAQ